MKMFGDNAKSRARFFFQWHKSFFEVLENGENDEHPGRSVTATFGLSPT